jgi:thioredoxin 2
MSYANLRTCPACGVANRIPAGHLSDTGRCGACKAALPPLAAPLEVDAAAFDEIVRSARVPVFVDFWAAWCGPCRMAAPEVEALAREMAGRAVVLKVDTERNQQVAATFRIQSIPTFMVFRDGKAVAQRSGVIPHNEMRRWVEQSAV